MTLKSAIRHFATFLVGTLIAWLTHLLGNDLTPDVTAGLNGLTDPLAVALGAVAAVGMKVAIEKFPALQFLSDEKASGGGTSGGNVPSALFLLTVGMGTVVMVGMTSCATVSTTALDGTVTTTQRYDVEAGNPFLSLARDLFGRPAPAVPVIPVDAK